MRPMRDREPGAEVRMWRSRRTDRRSCACAGCGWVAWPRCAAPHPDGPTGAVAQLVWCWAGREQKNPVVDVTVWSNECHALAGTVALATTLAHVGRRRGIRYGRVRCG